MRVFIKYCKSILFAFLIFLCFTSIFLSISSLSNQSKIPSVFGFTPMTVLTGSMSPKINPGDIIVDKKVDFSNLKIGDIVTYRVNQKMLVTHRIVEISEKEDTLLFKTKGDANNTVDNKLVDPNQLVGSYVFRIPYMGFVSEFVRSFYGYVLLVLIPVVVLIWDRIKTILSERKRKKIEKKDNSDGMDL